MIISSREWTAVDAIRADVCIVGAGPSGISLALRLSGKGLDILVLEAGGDQEDEVQIDPKRGEVVDPALHSPTHLYRHRMVGGSTVSWGGRCVPFDPIDFEKREWIPDSGWPISYDTVQAYYPDALRLLEAGDYNFSAELAIDGGMRKTIQGFRSNEIDEDNIERFSCPTHFGKRWRKNLSDASDIRLVTDAYCTEVIPSANRDHVDYLIVKNPAGVIIKVDARQFVLAMGGLETPRLLLASCCRNSKGLANDFDLVGRYYMCHVAGTTGSVRFSIPGNSVFHGYERTWDGVYCRRRFQLTADAQRKHRVGNIVGRLHHPRIPDPGHGSGILSSIYLAKPFISAEYSKRLHGAASSSPGVIAKHILNVAREIPATTKFLFDWAWRRTLAERKLPSIVVRPPNGAYSLDVHAEQAPNSSSRVTITNDLDRFGVPRLRVDWRYLPIDIETVQKFVQVLQYDLSSAGVADLSVREDEIANDMLRDGAYGGHHIGTTRMANDPSQGVVDADCRVFGFDNLYIASASVFPTSSQANPTLTVVALALRLADHLGVKLTRRTIA